MSIHSVCSQPTEDDPASATSPRLLHDGLLQASCEFFESLKSAFPGLRHITQSRMRVVGWLGNGSIKAYAFSILGVSESGCPPAPLGMTRQG